MPAVRQAVILAGGIGRRLRPLTYSRPKPMVEVRGTPILQHQIDWFAEHGVEYVVVSAGYKAEVITAHLGSRRQPLHTQVVVEERPLGRGGGLNKAAGALPWPSEPWFALYGDIWTSFCLSCMVNHHRRQDGLATVALARPRAGAGTAVCDAVGRVITLNLAEPLAGRVNAGLYLFEPSVTGLLPKEGDHQTSTLAHLISTRNLVGYPVDEPWTAVNTPQDLDEAARTPHRATYVRELPSDEGRRSRTVT
ncbi:nucleotidyltransferase family protein [Streptomyces sp. HNM0574]|uniref:nucleotidyltransferase family protein n=1 Tax=Streptomyces sp. HNM0574 TaxID=2714954 RepID=UPI001F0EBDEC|nr:nucleotidyltransferase family protein [Streptomyces sp. HNM0574]